ncbi:hypothetical protein N9924_00850 [bacterium]|nr:hypothetical protein [bacterium]
MKAKLSTTGTPEITIDKDCKIVDLTNDECIVSYDDVNLKEMITNLLTAYKETFKDAEEADRDILDLAIDVMEYDLLEEYDTKIKTLEERLENE